MLLALLALATTISTVLGGLVALRNKHKINTILGFTAGALLGVVSFDVFPEIFTLVHEHNIPPIAPMMAFVVGFLAFHVVEKLTIIHYMHEDEYAEHKHPQVGVLSALALIGHSFADGIGINTKSIVFHSYQVCRTCVFLRQHLTIGYPQLHDVQRLKPLRKPMCDRTCTVSFAISPGATLGAGSWEDPTRCVIRLADSHLDLTRLGLLGLAYM